MATAVDSCGWLAYFKGEERAGLYAPALEGNATLVVPTICVYEVYRRLSLYENHNVVMKYVEKMLVHSLVPLTEVLAIEAAQLAASHSLHMSDALILATAYSRRAELWTHDAHFKGLPGVRYLGE